MATYSNKVGIDFGSSSLCLAVWDGERPETVRNSSEFRRTPTCISYRTGNPVVGEDAFHGRFEHAGCTVSCVKAVLAAHTEDARVLDVLQYLPFPFYRSTDGYSFLLPRQTPGGYPQWDPPEYAIRLLMEYMANLSRQFLGRGARSAVVALSSYLTYEQRLLVERAVFACGMSPIVVPSAALAAVAFSFLSGWFAVPQMPSNRRRVLAIDVGCTLDFALVDICGQVAEIQELGGDKYIGGDHVDWLMLRHCQQQYLTQFDVDLATHRESWSMLRSSCQTAKCVLSQNMRAEVTAPVGGHLKSISLSRGRLEELILEVLEQFQEKIVSFRGKNVTDVVLIGGSARMPAFQRAVFDVFSPESGEQPSVHVLPNRLVQPDELVAAGAAIVAASSSLSVGELPGPNVRVAMCHDRRLSVDTSAGPLEIVPAGCRVPSSNSVTVRIRSRQSAITIRERGQSRGPCLGLLYFFNLQSLPVSVELLEVRVFVHETMHLTVSLCSGEYELIRHDITLESISLAREAERACPRTTILPDHA